MAPTTLRITPRSLHRVPGGPDGTAPPLPLTLPPATLHLLTRLIPAAPAPQPLLWSCASLTPTARTTHVSLCLAWILPAHASTPTELQGSLPSLHLEPFHIPRSAFYPFTLQPLASLYFPSQQLLPPALILYIFVQCPSLPPRM